MYNDTTLEACVDTFPATVGVGVSTAPFHGVRLRFESEDGAPTSIVALIGNIGANTFWRKNQLCSHKDILLAT